MKEYSLYKNSGNKLIGSIPEHWQIILFKRVIEKIKDGTHGSFNRVPEGRPLLSAKNVFDNGLYISETESLISDEDYQEIVKNGFPRKKDLLITCVGTIGRSMVYDLDVPHAFQRSVSFLRLRNEIANPKFYKYFVQCEYYQRQLLSVAKTSAQSGVYMGDIVNTVTVLPSLEEQIQIAFFLDQKVAQIDKLISDKVKLTELLNEELAVLINQAVTKGLNLLAPTQDSDIEWLGAFPCQWKKGKLKFICDLITDGSHYSPSSLETGRRYISVKDVKNNIIDFKDCKYISDLDFEQLERNGCRPIKGDILLTKDGTIGRASIVEDDNDFVILSSLALIRPSKNIVDFRYLKYFLLSSINVDQMLSSLQGSALTRITLTIINNLIVVIPPLEEQLEILNFIESKSVVVNDLVEKVQKEVDYLIEYKTALISEVVTGKIDVRSEAITELLVPM